MNTEILKGKWTEAKGSLQTMWGKLTSDELEETKGNIKAIAGLVQQKYGHAKDDIQAKLDQLLAKFASNAEETQEKVGQVAANKTEELKEKVKSAN